MFGISFSEFLIVFIVALIVIGPQKLPETIRAVGSIVNKIRSFADQVKNEVSKEFETDELKRSIEETKQSFTKQINDTTQLDEVKQSLREARHSTEDTLRNSRTIIDQTLKSDSSSAATPEMEHFYDDYHYEDAPLITAPPKGYQAALTDITVAAEPEDALIHQCRARQLELFLAGETAPYTAYRLKYAKTRHLESLPNLVDRYHDTLVELNQS
ncbi:twin-arginine translocase subunit TatB [Wohlfahrtiimonas chitiniclastica]|uniref:Sec-independent protein translocase protein TatB n=1 Tax=Wohlfahrtiimonas chitiniclastica SH04 TaxID=1261130 RepID=L8Y1K3_9GAMM|nr:Sec-independent protein translocase protein TatB [Wohlfahrtiimonas chitiniclastica]ELV08919.1 Sec-independent protein translocase protein TatB [Wohlfahrtiimonas chitiniclastica SH04]MBS7817725.1 twin-arginine translocase subunit TatB [Wohlfahrtiimonas chitiniclastica]MBS7825692.1 twin-arginine translocase subunit TatB [Wohlfahrtiimonas chitiniclastica]